MKIENSIVNLTSQSSGSVKSTKADKASAPSTASATVQLSTKMQAVKAQASSAGVFDAQKVQEIKAAIAEGRFQVNAEAVADGLMATVKDLIKSHSRTA